LFSRFIYDGRMQSVLETTPASAEQVESRGAGITRSENRGEL
jgi:hypothetical protein